MIERACDIVEMPGGGLAALMPLPDVTERHWVAVQPGAQVLRAQGHVHRLSNSWRIAGKPWEEHWKPVGRREVVVVEQDNDFDLGGGD